MMKAAGWIIFLVIFLWAATRLLENRMTYYPTGKMITIPKAAGIVSSDIDFLTDDGIRLHGWYCIPPAGAGHRADILFLPGNAGNISFRVIKIKPLLDMGLGVFLFDYRGYGDSEGRPDDRGVIRDAAAAFKKFGEITTGSGRSIGIFGESLGCLLAIRLAAGKEDLSFMILEGSFPGKRALAARYPPFWPFSPFISGTLDMDNIPMTVICPVMIMHARDDEVVPFSLGRKVFEKFGGRASFHEIGEGGHNDSFVVDKEFYPAIDRFIDSVLTGADKQPEKMRRPPPL